MALNRPNQLTTAFANAGLKNDIPQSATGSNLASYEEGFPAVTMTALADGGTPPQGQDFNGMFYTLTDIARYAQAGGLYPFNQAFCTAIGGYPLGAVLTSLDGTKLYKNTVNGNINDPDSNQNGWKTFLTADQIDAVPTDGSGNPVASDGVYDALATKQGTLTFDNSPTANSSNPVKSSGIKSAIDAVIPAQSGNAGMVLTTDGTDVSWQPVQSRNVGEYVWSALPLTDAGLHLMDGSIIAEGGIYDAFVQYVASLSVTYPDAFCTETEWQASVNTYGSCGKFVYTQGTGVRLPKVSDILQGTTDVTAVGGLIEAGLPNVTGGPFPNILTAFVSTSEGNSGAFKTEVTSADVMGTTRRSLLKLSFDASLSNAIYGNSTTVQPQTIQALLYICIANSVKTQVQVDIDEIATDLNGKLNRSGGTMSGVLSIPAQLVMVTETDVQNAGAVHNSIWRGKYLGAAVSSEQSAAIRAGTFDDIYIGDYWIISNVVWRVAAIDYYYNTGDTACTTHHVVVVPDTALYQQRMNASNTVSGGWVGSEMYQSGLNAAKTTIASAFSGHLLTIRQLFLNACDGNYGFGTGIAWYDASVWLMTEQNVYGGALFDSQSNGNAFAWKHTLDNRQYPLFAMYPTLRRIDSRNDYWLRNPVNATFFALVSGYGHAGAYGASAAFGVRPAFCVF